MCDRSNSPARSRTARCSSRMPAYWTGISQPPNSMSFAPSAAWRVDERGHVDGCVGRPPSCRSAAPVAAGAGRRVATSGRRARSARRARRARARSRRSACAGASAKPIQRTCVELVVVAARSPPVGLHQEVVDGLVDPGAALDERSTRSSRAGRRSGPRGRSPRRPRGAPSARSSRRRGACPWAGSRSRRRARAGGCRRRGGRSRPRTGRRCRRRKWRWRVLSRATAPRRRWTASAARAAPEPAQCIATRDAAGRSADRARRGADGAPAARGARTSGRRSGRRSTVRRGRRGLERAGAREAEPPLPGPRRGADEARRRAGRVLRGDAVLHRPQSYRVRTALQVTVAGVRRASGVSAPRSLGELDLAFARARA